MSEFMKNIVAEVLNSNTKLVQSKSNPIKSNKHIKPTAAKEIVGVERPNYQKQKIEKRLAVLEEEQAETVFPSKNQSLNQASRTTLSTNTHNSRTFIEGSLANLIKMSLVQGNMYQKQPNAYAEAQSNVQLQKGKLIGKSKDDTYVWFFPTIHPNLQTYFHRTPSQQAVVVVTAQSCLPSQLFLLNAILREHSDLKYYICWDKSCSKPFKLELLCEDANRLEKIAKHIFQKIGNRSMKKIDSTFSHSPSAWLCKQLDITQTVQSVGVIEGIDYYGNLFLLDRFLKSKDSSNLAFKVEEKYLLVTGGPDKVEKAVLELRKECDRT
ncbi:hypothetical protein LCL95_02245 [Bacillus timonensis]|nr:hypothetical protein [Bacillus timonensis]